MGILLLRLGIPAGILVIRVSKYVAKSVANNVAKSATETVANSVANNVAKSAYPKTYPSVAKSVANYVAKKSCETELLEDLHCRNQVFKVVRETNQLWMTKTRPLTMPSCFYSRHVPRKELV